ncbi:MAG: serine hydrolase domain-containing protein [Mycobacteriales bacterium]
MSELQETVQRTLDELVAGGAARGLQAAVYRHGVPVVDAVAGVADPATGRPVTPDTPFWSASTGKGMAATVVHVLAERGVLDYDTPLVVWWPEFGAHGKDRVTLRHVLTHSAGLPAVPPDTTVEDLCDWSRMCAMLATAEPWWEPGTKTAYHSHTFGYLVGEVVRRATGRPLGQVLAEEVSGPLGIGRELYFGVPATDLPRLARIEDAPGWVDTVAALPDGAPILRLVPRRLVPTAAQANRPDVLTADIPSTGTLTARAAARMYAALLGPVDGVRLVSPARLGDISTVALSGVDEVMGNSAAWALGYSLGWAGATAFGMPGTGGSAAYADLATATAVAVTTNRLDPAAGLTLLERVAGAVTAR